MFIVIIMFGNIVQIIDSAIFNTLSELFTTR